MGSFFDLILVFIFIVLPVISNLIKASQKRNKTRASKKEVKKQAQQSTAQQRPTQPQVAQPRAAKSVVQAEQSAPAGSAASSKADFERRLAEARARVQQSMDSGNPSGKAQPKAQVNTSQSRQPQPTTRQGLPPQQRPQQRSQEVLKPLGGRTAKAQSIESASLEGQSLEGRSLEGRSLEGQSLERQFQRTAPVRHQRLQSSQDRQATNLLLGGLSKKKAKKQAAINSDKLLTMDDKSIMRGLVWKQILDTPKSKKRISNYKLNISE